MNTDKSHLIVSGCKCLNKFKHDQVWAQNGGDKIWKSVDVKLLSVTIDRELKFHKHVSNIFLKNWDSLIIHLITPN